MRTVPPHLLEGLRLYVDRGVPLGSFLTACVDNKLVDAFAHADHISTAAMPAIAAWLYQDAPSPCWGSPEKRAAWIARGGLRGKQPPTTQPAPCSACNGTGNNGPRSADPCVECGGEGVQRLAP